MKSRSKLVCAAFVILILVAVLFLNNTRFKNAAPTPEKRAGATGRESFSGTSQEKAQSTDTADTTKNEGISSQEMEVEKAKLQTVRRVMEREEVPLNFYGHVVDENGAGVSGATVKITYTYFDVTLPQYRFRGDRSFTIKSDAQGFFTIKGVKGYSLGLDVGKEGYFASTNNFRGAVYVHPARGYEFTPDASKPVVFRLRKKGVAEPLIRRSKSYRLPRDGAPVFVDLATGRTNSPMPDLKIQAWTDDSHKDAQSRYDWRVMIEVLNGGLIERGDEFQYTAPEQGYVTSFRWDYPRSKGADWRSDATSSMFIRLRNGEMYARIKFEMIAGGDHFCMIESFLNPSGSHNLEPGSGLLFQDMDSYSLYMAKQ